MDEINSKGGIGGRPIQLIGYDDQSSPEVALSFAKKLVEQDKVTAIIGIGVSSLVRATDPYIQSAQIPNVVGTPVVVPMPRGWTFATSPELNTNYTIRFEYMKRHNVKTIAMLASSDTTGQAGVELMKQLAPKYGMTVASESFNLTDTDVTPQLTKLKALNTDVVVSEVSGKAFATVVKGFLQLGFKTPLYGGTGAISPTMTELLGGTVIGVNEPETMYFPTQIPLVWQDLPATDPVRANIEHLLQLYKAKYSDTPSISALAVGYEQATLLFQAMQRAGSLDKGKIRDALETTKGFVGVFGTVNMTPEDHRGLGTAGAAMVYYKQGQYRLLKD